MKLGSLFDGSGTAPLAAAMCGIEPVWASEIEPFPIKVTSKRFPRMKHLGNILDINGAEIEPVDIICGGSPCQDLSVAGKQKGLHEGERSHLFFEMTRIIREMRGATNGKYPRYVIWENVPGVFGSNNGNDFLAVLHAFAEIADPDVHVPRPPRKGKTDRLDWKYSGSIVGDGWSIVYRTVDAQYWGVPQRRRRLYLVADLASERAGEVLFERKSLSGNPEPSGTPRQGTAEDAEGCSGGSGGAWSLSAKQQSLATDSECAATIRANDFKEPQAVAYDITGSSSNSMKSPTPDSCFRERSVSRTLDSFVGSPDCNQGGTVIVDAYPDVARTLTAEHDASPCIDRGQNVTVYAADCRNAALNEELSATLQAKDNGGFSYNFINPVVYAIDQQGGKGACNYAENTMPTLLSDSHGTPHGVVYDARGNGTGGGCHQH